MTNTPSPPEPGSGPSELSGALRRWDSGFDPQNDLAVAPPQGVIGPAVPPQGAPPTFDPWTLLRAKWLILGTFAALCAVSIPAVWLLVEPSYQAAASVRVSPVVSRIAFATEDQGVPYYRQFLNTQVSIIRGPAVLARVLDRKDIQATRWYREPRHVAFLPDRRDPLERLRDELDVVPRRDTELIDVAIRTDDGRESKLIVDAVVDEYKRYLDAQTRESDVQRFETLTEEQADLQRDIDGLVKAKFEVSKRLGTTDPENLRSQLSEQLNLLETERASLKRRLALAKWQLAAVERRRAVGTKEGEDGDRPIYRYADDPEWRQLNRAVETANRDLAVGRNQYGESHPQIQRLAATAEHAERLLKEREAQLDEYRTNPGMFATASGSRASESPEEHIEFLDAQVKLIEADIDSQRQKVVEAGDVAKQIAQYDEEIRHKRELYETVRSRITALRVESNAPARVTIAAHAVAPSVPTRDRRLVLTVLAIGGAMMLALALGYLRTATDPRIREASEVRSSIQVPFLGQLPAVPESADLMADTYPAVQEGIRMIRTALLERLDPRRANVVLVTSASSRSGKTSFSILLSRSLAELGKRTLLVEGDTRRPSIASRLHLEGKEGLAAMLAGQAPLEGTILHGAITRLDILTAGEIPPEFRAELLANGVFTDCLQRWRQEYDMVVLDSPPLLPVADARIMARLADGTILVARSSHSRRTEVMQAYGALQATGTRVLGAILLGVAQKSGYGYSDYYGSYDYRPYTPTRPGSS